MLLFGSMETYESDLAPQPSVAVAWACMETPHRLNRITVDPEVMQGQPCIRGLRIPVRLILKLLAAGRTAEQIRADYPEIEPEDISQCIAG